PAPNYAEAFLTRVKPFSASLLSSLESEFNKMTGVVIERQDWRLAQLPEYLLMTFRVEDEQGKLIAEHKSLTELKAKLQHKVTEQLEQAVEDNFEQHELQHWNFGQLPQCYEKQQAGYILKAYPALVDGQHHVSIKLLDSPQQQQQAMQQGLRRLLLLNVPSPIKYLHEKLPNKAKLGLYFAP